MTVSTEGVWSALREELLHFFRRRVRDEHVAEDLLQETFVRVHDGLRELEREERLAAWVYRIARNVLADHQRAPARESGLDEADANAEPSARDSGTENCNAEVSDWLRSMLSALSPEQRAAIELAEDSGLAQREVAERLQLSLSGAKSRVQRGRRRLEELLLDCCHLDFDRRGNVVDYERRGRSRSCCEGSRSR